MEGSSTTIKLNSWGLDEKELLQMSHVQPPTPQLLGGSSQGLETWWITMVHGYWLISPLSRAVPFRNGLTPWLIHGGDPITTWEPILQSRMVVPHARPFWKCKWDRTGDIRRQGRPSLVGDHGCHFRIHGGNWFMSKSMETLRFWSFCFFFSRGEVLYFLKRAEILENVVRIQFAQMYGIWINNFPALPVDATGSMVIGSMGYFTYL